MYEYKTDGWLIDRQNSLTDNAKSGSASVADRREWESIGAELDRRWRSDDMPREDRTDNRATESDIAEVAGYPAGNFSTNRAASSESRAFTHYLRTGVAGEELRSQGESAGGTGGFLVPQSFLAQVQIALKMYGGLSQDFQPHPTPDGRVMPFPTHNPTGIVASYITENTQLSNTTYAFGQGQLFAWTITSGIILASLQLVQDSATDVDSFVADRIGEAIGRKLAAEAVSGVGPASKAATGIIPSLSDFGTSNSSGGYFQLGSAAAVQNFGHPNGSATTELASNSLAPATLAKMITSVDPAYYDGAAFYMNSAQAWGERQIVDNQGRPLLNLDNGFADGAIGSIYGFPVKVVQEIPNLTASTVGGPIFGNMKHAMMLRMVDGMTLDRQAGSTMRLVERYADYLQVGYIGWQRFDIQPVDLRAAVTVEANSS